MNSISLRISRFLASSLTFAMILTGLPQPVYADEIITADASADYSYGYTRNAVIMDKDKLPGVYSVAAVKGDNKDTGNATLGMPSIAKQNLQTFPTTESPAIIQGAAVPFEKRVCDGSKIEFEKISDEPICAPYSKFRYKIMDEANANTTDTTHKKISGFDGTYVIMRVDVSDLIKDAPEGSYLHVKQENNKAMLTAVGQEPLDLTSEFASVSFTDNTGTRASCYSLSNNAASLKDTDGISMETPYIDIVMMSSGTIVAGADKGTVGAVSADFPVSFYVDQTKDYDPSIEWDSTTSTVKNTDTRETVTDQTDSSGKVIKTAQAMILDKYYNEAKAKETGLNDADITSYTVKGDDLELEVMVDETIDDINTQTQYWSLRRAMDYQRYNRHTIRLMCEVPVLEGLLVEDTVGTNDREVVLDVNSFDIQIANHAASNTAGLTVKGASLTVKDDSNTTGAELAVGNNASMVITDNGRLVIDKTCQVEVEYDAASVSAGSVPQNNVDYANGLITVENGGEIVNNGIITVEGKEGKAAGADAATIVRNYKDACLTIGVKGKLTNNGCVLVNGYLYNFGTIINNGHYDDVIVSNDPDKGTFTYHKGMQLSWKDDVTQGHTNGGMLINGRDEKNNIYPDAKYENNGDLVLIPGYVFNFANMTNKGNIFLTAVDEVIIPITATQDAPTVTEQRIQLGYPETSYINNFENAIFDNSGNIRTADFEITSNGRTGNIKSEVNPYLDKLWFMDWGGKITNSGNGIIAVSQITSYGEVINKDQASMQGTYLTDKGSTDVSTKILLVKLPTREGIYTDSSKNKTDNVYNAAKTSNNGTDNWTYNKIKKLSVSPASASVGSGQTVNWTIHAEPEAANDHTKYLIMFIGENKDDEYFTLPTTEDYTMESPKAPASKCNLVYYFTAMYGGSVETSAVLRVNDQTSSLGVVRPTAMQNLVYNGEEQFLVTAGYATEGILQYSINGSDFSSVRPKAKDAGKYTVAYRVILNEGSSTILDEGGTIEVTIAKRPLYMSADDKGSKTGDAIRELTYTAFGIMPADKEALNIKLTTTATSDSDPGEYPVSLTWTENPNYEFTNADGTSRISDGTYFITGEYLNMSVSSNLIGYRNMNEGLGVIAKYKKDPSKTTETVCTVYYSDKTALNKDNYKTDGAVSLTYAAVGTDKTVYYYIVEPQIAGSKKIVITKADQKAPGLKSEGGALEAKADHQNVGGSSIEGFKVREMEYRAADNDVYTRAIYESHNVPAGTYYVRMIGDEHYNPSPDTEIAVPEPGKELTVTFDPNGGTLNSPETATVNYGEALTEPAVPTRELYQFLGWTYDDKPYDFSRPVTGNYTLVADWNTIKYTVTFDSDGGTTILPKKVEAGKTVADPGSPLKEGYQFLGWTLNGADYSFDAPVNQDITLKAAWTPIRYFIAFEANGGNGVMEAQEFTYDEAKALTRNAFTKDYYEFTGWNSKADGSGQAYDDRQQIKNLLNENNETVTLYAQWKKSLSSPDISVTVEEDALKYTGREIRPNVTVKDGDSDITRFCRFTYSDNINAGTAKVTVSIQGNNSIYSNKETVTKEFTIGKSDKIAPVFYELSQKYFRSDEVSDGFNFGVYLSKLPADRGTTSFTVSVNGGLSFNSIPSISSLPDTNKLNLSYSLKPADKESSGNIIVTASMQNYEDSALVLNIRQIESAIYQKHKKDYIPFLENPITGSKYTLAVKTSGGIVTKGVEWTSSDPSVATISKTGALKVKAAGQTTLTAKTGTLSANCVISVTEAVKKVNISKKNYSMGVGEYVVLTADALPAEAEQTILWSENKNGSIVDITYNDDMKSITVKAKAKGSVKLTAAAVDGSGRKATCNISVGDPVTGFSISARGNKNFVAAGKKLPITVTWEGTKPKNKDLIWKVTLPDGTDASKFAAITQKGLLTGSSEGTVRVTAISISNPSKTAYVDVDVYVPVKKAALSAAKGEINLTDKSSSLTVSAIATPAVAVKNATGERLGSEPTVIFTTDSKYAGLLVIEKSGNTATIKASSVAAATKNIPVKVTIKAFNGYSKTLTYKVTLK